MRRIGGELKDYFDARGITQRQLAEKLGVSTSYINLLFTNRRGFGKKAAHRWHDLFGFSVNWLLYGTGGMMAADGEDADSGRMVSLPLVPQDALAGLPAQELDGAGLDGCEHYAVPDFLSNGAELLVRVSGDSMTPKYNNGDVVAVRRVEEVLFFQWGKIYVLDTSQGILIKRVYAAGDDDHVICHSENTAVFADFALPKADIRALYIVVGVIRLE